MPIADDVNRIYREFRRYTGDGLPGEPVGAPLPVGDPRSGVYSPDKAELRAALLTILGGIDTAASSAIAAQLAAESAAGANLAYADSRLAATSVNFPPGVNYVRTAGFAAPGDGGGAIYKRVGSEPAHPGKFQSGNGVWFEIAEAVLNVRMLGAKSDGTDAAGAFANALAAAVALGQNIVVVPPGTFDLASRLDMTTANLTLLGAGEEVTALRRRAGATLTVLLHCGPTSGTTAVGGVSVRNLTLDGNGSCSEAVVKVRNIEYGRFDSLEITGGTGDGLKSETSTTSINTRLLRNHYSEIRSHDNDGKGLHFIGEKDGRFDELLAHNNVGDGIVWRGFKDDAASLAETTTCTIGSALSRDNGGSGFVFDGTEKFVAGTLLATINSLFGVQFKSSDTGAASIGTNNINIASLTLRANTLGGVRVADGARMIDATFGHVLVIGINGNAGTEGVRLDGVARVNFGTLHVLGQRGTGVRIRSGTPLGVAAQSTDVTIGTAHIQACGVAGSASHGMSIEDSTSGVSLGQLISKNAETKTATTNYELNVSVSSTNIVVSYAHLDAFELGREYSGTTVDFCMLKMHINPPHLFVRESSTPVVIPGYAAIYVDSSDGDLKARFDNSIVKLIVAD